jgi:hypothetical protein
MAMGQSPSHWTSKPKHVLTLIAALPVAIVIIVAAAMCSWVAFWFVVRACVYLHDWFLAHWWY